MMHVVIFVFRLEVAEAIRSTVVGDVEWPAHLVPYAALALVAPLMNNARFSVIDRMS